GRRLFVVLDNWPVHFHPDVLADLEPQWSPFTCPRPPAWPAAPTRRHTAPPLPIQLVPLPTYASWLTPIETPCRLPTQARLHLHRRADDLPARRDRVLDFLARFQDAPPDLLRYVGLEKTPP